VTVVGLLVYSSLYPLPSDVAYNNKSEMSLWYDSLPNEAYAVKIFINGIAVFIVALLSSIIANSKKRNGFIGLVIFMIILYFRDERHDYPQNYYIVSNLVLLIFGLLGMYLGSLKEIRESYL
jgi:hypothetical protein